MSNRARKFNFKTVESEAKIIAEEPTVLKFYKKEAETINSSEVQNLNSKKFSFSSKEKNNEIIKKKKFKSDLYFGVKNHIDLFEVGKYYAGRIDQGRKKFAFYGDSDNKKVHHSLVGIASFFNYHRNLKVTVILEKFNHSELSKLISPSHIELEQIDGLDEDDLLEVLACDGIEIIELEKLRHMAFKLGVDNFKQYIDDRLEKSDLVLWELPDLVKINTNKEFYLPFIEQVDSLSFVVEKGKTNSKELKEISNFVQKYQVTIDGVLFYNLLESR